MKHRFRIFRRFRFSLKSLAVCFISCCVLIAWWVGGARDQQIAANWVRESGGSLYYSFQWDRQKKYYNSTIAPPTWLGGNAGIDYFSSIHGVAVYGYQGQPGDVSPLARLKNLRSCDISSCGVADISPLSKLKLLEYLCLDNNPIGELSPLKKLSNLEYLSLSRTKICDVQPLQDLKNLARLNLSWCDCIDLSPLKENSSITELDISYSRIDNIQPLHSIRNLRILDLSGVPLTKEQIEAFQAARPQCLVTTDSG